MPDGLENQQSSGATKLRSAVYIDAFNLYYAIQALRKDHLKWLNLWALSEARRPNEYGPPDGWLHPTRRPAK